MVDDEGLRDVPARRRHGAPTSRLMPKTAQLGDPIDKNTNRRLMAASSSAMDRSAVFMVPMMNKFFGRSKRSLPSL